MKKLIDSVYTSYAKVCALVCWLVVYMAGDPGPFQGKDLGKEKGGLLLGAQVSRPLLETQLGKLGWIALLSSFPFPEIMVCVSSP